MANEQIVLTDEEATALRNALRDEKDKCDEHELATLRARIAAMEAISNRRAVFESIADAHNFDATDSFTFDFQSRTLTIQKGRADGNT